MVHAVLTCNPVAVLQPRGCVATADSRLPLVLQDLALRRGAQQGEGPGHAHCWLCWASRRGTQPCCEQLLRHSTANSLGGTEANPAQVVQAGAQSQGSVLTPPAPTVLSASPRRSFSPCLTSASSWSLWAPPLSSSSSEHHQKPGSPGRYPCCHTGSPLRFPVKQGLLSCPAHPVLLER